MDCESNPVKVQDGSSQGSHEESSCCEASVLNIVVSLNKIQMCCWDRKENHPSTVVMKGKLAFGACLVKLLEELEFLALCVGFIF